MSGTHDTARMKDLAYSQQRYVVVTVGCDLSDWHMYSGLHLGRQELHACTCIWQTAPG